MPRCKCHHLSAPFLVLKQRAQHGLDSCGLSQLIPRANQAGNGVYFTPSILPTVKLLKDDYIAVDLNVGGLCPTNKSLATIYPTLFTISTIGLQDVSCSSRTRSLHPLRGTFLLPPPGNFPMWFMDISTSFCTLQKLLSPFNDGVVKEHGHTELKP